MNMQVWWFNLYKTDKKSDCAVQQIMVGHLKVTALTIIGIQYGNLNFSEGVEKVVAGFSL